jgi:hypothetical protein
MPTLTLHQTDLGDERYRIGVATDLPGLTLQHDLDIRYRLATADRNLIRWYLEDYLDQPFDPNPSIAERAERRIAEIGRDLFETLFDGRRMIEWWARAKDRLPELRIEICTSVAAASAIPWELLRDPVSDTALAGVWVYALAFPIALALGAVLIGMGGADFDGAWRMSAAALTNAGPLAAVDWSQQSPASLYAACVMMVLGRLEVLAAAAAIYVIFARD